MLEYQRLKKDRRQLLALTGLPPKEFGTLYEAFGLAYAITYPEDKTAEGQDRQRRRGGGRKGQLATTEQKLLFSLVYLKTYRLQALLGAMFGLSQSQVNRWLQRLLPIVKRALDELGVLPSRVPEQFAEQERKCQEPESLIIDGTDRRRQRPKNKAKQVLHYSGKHKTHSDKNIVVVNAKTKRVGYLSQTYAGKVHDKKIVDTEPMAYPPATILYTDTGFQGYEPNPSTEKKPRKGVLTRGQKRPNRKLSRVRAEHALAGVKRARIVKDVLRNTKAAWSDLVMVVACGLHNLRVRSRKRRLRT